MKSDYHMTLYLHLYKLHFKLKQSAEVIVLFLSCPVQYRKARQDPILSWEQKQMFGQKRDTADKDAFTIKSFKS